tara:strand:- start:1153 stop:2148 length:996 start_codon:yes stop_codon:yes gene_type:complete
MIDKQLTRRKFLDYAKLSFLFLLSSCQVLSKKISIGFHKKFLPKSFLDSLPKNWIKENINFDEKDLDKDLLNKDIILINDGWLNTLKIKDFKDINPSLITKLDYRSKSFLNKLELPFRKKLYPVGVIPYAVIIKNNHKYQLTNKNNWDFLLTKEFKGKMVLPNSSRVLISIADKIKNINSIKALVDQNNIYDDINAIDWLINTNAILAIMPITKCQKYLKIDSRLSLFFPNQGVPLMWNFLLLNNNFDQKELLEWLEKLINKNTFNRLLRDGWYLPFNYKNIQDKYKYINTSQTLSMRPSEECWKNSWSFLPLNESEKIKLNKTWNDSLTP